MGIEVALSSKDHIFLVFGPRSQHLLQHLDGVLHSKSHPELICRAPDISFSTSPLGAWNSGMIIINEEGILDHSSP